MDVCVCVCVCAALCVCIHAACVCISRGGGGFLSPLVATMQAVIEMQEGKRSPNLTLFPVVAAGAAAAGREARRQKLLQAGEKKGASPARMKLFDGNKSGF